MSIEYLRTSKEASHLRYLQFLAPGALRCRVLAGGGEAGESDAGVDIRSCLHPEMLTRVYNDASKLSLINN